MKEKEFILIIKVSSVFAIFLLCFIFGILPYSLKSCRTNTVFLSYANTFSGGLFLGIGVIHLLPEAVEKLEKISGLPLSYFIVFAAYSIILFIQKVIFGYINYDQSQNEQTIHQEVIERLKDDIEQNIIENYGSDNNLCYFNVISNRDTKASEIFNLNKKYKNDLPKVELKEDDIENQNQDQNQNEENIENVIKEKQNEENIKEVKDNQNEDNNLEENLIVENKDKENNKRKKEEEENDHEPRDESKTRKQRLTSYVLLVALSIHGLFECLALGIQSSFQGVVFLFFALLIHKWAESFALGICFIKGGLSNKQYLILMICFCLIGPAGTTIGIILSSLSSDLLEGISLAFSTGTFVYVACSEVIIEEFENPEGRYTKFFLYLFGGAIAAGLTIFEEVV